jgi:hypothetical protein
MKNPAKSALRRIPIACQIKPRAFSLHRSQISENFDFKEYVIDAGSGSRIRPARGRFCCFGDKSSKQYVSILSI